MNVTFVISNEDIQTKAVVGENPDWEKELTFGVYRNGSLLSPNVYSIKDFGKSNKAEVTVTLVKGEDYDFVFWADKKGSNYYNVDLEKQTVTVNYDKQQANDQYRDAWYNVLEGYTVAELNQIKEVTLHRAVAQINVGTRDYTDAETAGVTVTKSAVTIKGVAKTLELFTGIAKDITDVTFVANEIPMYSLPKTANTLTVKSGNWFPQSMEYEYLSLNYVLVPTPAKGQDKGLVTFMVDFYEDGSMYPVRPISEIKNVPVRCNYRTNIISSTLLTDDASFDIVIDPYYDGEYNKQGNGWNEVK